MDRYRPVCRGDLSFARVPEKSVGSLRGLIEYKALIAALEALRHPKSYPPAGSESIYGLVARRPFHESWRSFALPGRASRPSPHVRCGDRHADRSVRATRLRILVR
jgi:hypothetical protein